jgi:tetratricopeptide (TPR) repeat protein
MAAFLAALRVARSQKGVEFLGHVVVATASVVALAAILHPAFGSRRLFAFYDPGPEIGDRHIAPMMNPNNLAGYLNLAICLSLAGLLRSSGPIPKPLLAASTMLLAGAQIWIGSRAGVLTMVLGATIVVAVTFLSKRSGGRPITHLSWLIGLTIAVGGTLVVLGGSEGAATDLLHGDASKLTMFMRFVPMLPSVAVFGCGRGSFESTFPAFRTDPGFDTYAYPEHVVAQWTLEWGVPVGVLGLASVAFALRPNAMLARSRMACGAWSGLIALAVQNLADLGTEIPGLMLAAVVCAGIVVAGSPGERPGRLLDTPSRRPAVVAMTCVVAITIAAPVAALRAPRELHRDQRWLQHLAAEARVSPIEIHDAARAAMARHPAEPYLPFAVAMRAAERGDDNPMPWIEATLERATMYPPAHLVLARMLRRLSPAQARFEYRTAIAQWPDMARNIAGQSVDLVGHYSDALELVPAGGAGIAVLGEMVRDLRGRLPSTAARLDADLASRAPANDEPVGRSAEAAIDDLDAGEAAPWCVVARDTCARDALTFAERVEALSPDQCAGHVLRARAEVASGHSQRGLELLSESVDIVRDRRDCLEQLVMLDETIADVDRMEQDLSRLASAGCEGDDECSGLMAWIADREERHGNERRALAMYEKAAERKPDDEQLVDAVARLAAHTGLHAKAARSYQHLAKLFPDNPRWNGLAKREQTLALQGL